MIYQNSPGGSWQRFDEQQQQFGGGAKPPKQEPVKVPQTPKVDVPAPPAALAPIPPAPTTSKLEVQQAADDTRTQAARRKGVRQTLLAGETGGYGSTNQTAAPKKTLLG